MTSILPISTARLTLRAFREEDAATFHGWRNDPDVARYTLWECPYPWEEAERFCHEQATLMPFPAGEWYQVLIEETATGRAIGDIGIGNRVGLEQDDTITIGYSLSSIGQGKGYMTEALRALLPALIGPLRVRAFHAEIDERNPASGRVLERLGFTAGPVNEAHVFVKGEWCNEIFYDVAAEDLILGNKE